MTTWGTLDTFLGLLVFGVGLRLGFAVGGYRSRRQMRRCAR